MSGEDVLAVQLALAAQSYLNDNECDGIYGQKSADAVSAFQTDNGLNPNGQVDVITRMMLVD